MAIQADGAGGRRPNHVSAGIASPGFNLTRRPSAQQVVEPARPAAVAAPAPVADTGGGGGGGGGYDSGGGGYAAPAPAPAPPPRRSLEAILGEDFALRQLREENARQETEYGAETKRLRGDVERDQGLRRHDLEGDLQDMSIDSAEDLAGRGLLNSGGLFLNQDRINEEGAMRETSIADLLTQFLGQRATGLQGLQAAGRGKINDRMGALTSDYAAGRIN